MNHVAATAARNKPARFGARVRQLALLQLLDEHGRGDGLSMLALERLWQRTGLRRADLPRALAELRAQAGIALASADDDERVALLPSGSRRLAPETLGADAARSLVADLLALLAAAQRRPEPVAGFGRRHSDTKARS